MNSASASTNGAFIGDNGEPPPEANNSNGDYVMLLPETSSTANLLEERELADELVDKEDDETSSEAGEEVPLPLFERVLNRILCRGDIEDDKLEAKPVSYLDLFRFTSKCDKVFLFIACTFALIEGASLPAMFLIVGRLTNIYISTKDPVGNDEFFYKIVNLMYFYLVMIFVVLIISFIDSLLLRTVTARIIENLRREFMHAVLMQDAAWQDKHAAGALTNRLNSNIERIKDALNDKVGLIARGLATTVAATVIGFFVQAKLSCAMILMVPVAAMMMGAAPRFSAKPTAKSMKLFEDANAVSEEAILNVKTVASLNAQQSIVQKYSSLLTAGRRQLIKGAFITGMFEGTSGFILAMFFIGGMWYGITLFHSGAIKDAGTVIVVVNLHVWSAFVIASLSPHMMCILKARVSCALIYKTIDRIPTTMATSGTRNPTTARFDIRFEDVHFGYAGRKSAALDGVSWHVNEGETVALVGASGCGKSTSVALLTRLYEITSGKIELDGIDIREFDVVQLRKLIGVVSQEPSLFHGSIADNIRLGREWISEEDVVDSAKTANAHDFIMQLEKGYSTLLGGSAGGGVSLSGGQKQRIAIARAIAGQPRMLLLDEATSALDAHSERVVQEALLRASAGRTTVMIAHRLASIRHATRLYVMHEGRVVESGTYDELCSIEGGRFAGMVAMQTLAKEEDKEESDEDEDEEEEAPAPLSGIARISMTRRQSSRTSHGSDDHAPLIDSSEGVHDSSKKKEASDFMKGGLMTLMFYNKTRLALLILVSVIRSIEYPAISISEILFFRAFWVQDYLPILVRAAAVEFSAAVVMWMFSVTMEMSAAYFAEKTLGELRAKALHSLLLRPAAYFDVSETSTASSAVALSQHAPASAGPLDQRAAGIFESFGQCMFSIAILLYYCWPNAITSLVCAFVMAVFFDLCGRLLRNANDRLEEVDETAELGLEMFENVRTIQLLAVEDFFTSRFEHMQKLADKQRTRKNIALSMIHASSRSFIWAIKCAGTMVSVRLVYYGYFKVDAVYLSEISIGSIGYAVMGMSESISDILECSRPAQKMFALINPNDPDIHEGAKPMIKGAVSLRRVTFRYPTRPTRPAARKLTLDVAPKETIALVGPSGGGKSTIISLLERFYDPQHGAITLDDNLLGSLSLHHLRASLSLVGQEPVLFRGSIADNIRLGVEGEVSDEQIREAAKAAAAASFIEALPEGYDTPIGEAGRLLSGGQRQRIAIARALVRQPKVLLLDEATAALDAAAEQSVRRALESSSVGRTTITIAHRLASIENVRTIHYIEDGRIVESGSHQELLRRRGKYAALAAQQSLA